MFADFFRRLGYSSYLSFLKIIYERFFVKKYCALNYVYNKIIEIFSLILSLPKIKQICYFTIIYIYIYIEQLHPSFADYCLQSQF